MKLFFMRTLFFLTLVTQGVSLHAQTVPVSPNLVATAVTTTESPLFADGTFTPEYSPWNVSGATVFKFEELPVSVTLAQESEIKALILQADWNDSYHIDCSLDNSEWRYLWTAVPQGGIAGLVTRSFILGSAQRCRYLRIRGGKSDGTYSIAEFQAFADVPADWEERRSPESMNREWYPWLSQVDAAKVDIIRQILSIVGLSLLIWIVASGAVGERQLSQRAKYCLYATAAIAFAAWSNFFQFHYGSPIHRHEFFHYYLGSKYLPELQYTRLYRCAVLAQIESGFEPRTDVIRDLSNNRLESTEIVKGQPSLCKERFTDQRWQSFKEDLSWFEKHLEPDENTRTLHDHGFNGTPVWAIAGSFFSNFGKVTSAQLYGLGLLDLILMSLAWVTCLRVFGGMATAIAVIFWGANAVACFAWTGNGFLRADWLACTLFGICALKKERFRAAGALLMLSGLLRIFPLAFFGATLLRLLYGCVGSERKLWLQRLWSFSIGGSLAIILSLPLSFHAVGGLEGWKGFIANTQKHAGTYSTNIMGLPAIFSTTSDTWSTYLEDSGSTNGLENWVEKKREIFDSRKWLYLVVVIFILVLFLQGIKEREPWEAAILGSIVISIIRLSNYDYYFLLLYGLLFSSSPMSGILLLGVAAFSWPLSDISSVFDQRYFGFSILIQVFLIVCAFKGGLKGSAVVKSLDT
jgi:hypothetical protein